MSYASKISCQLILAVVLVGAAAAQDDARAHFFRGQAAYENGDYDTAVREWTTAYGMDPRPLLQFNLAQAYERLGRLGEARQAYERYINASDNDPGRMSQARARMQALSERLGRTSIVLHGGPEGAQIILDGQDRGRLPRPDALPLEPGQHQIVIRAPGYSDFVLDTAVSAGQQLPVNVTMRPGQSGTASLSGGSGLSLVGIIIAGAGVAALGTSIVTGLLALSGAQSAPDSTGPAAQDARTMGLVTDVLWISGAALAATGALLMFLLPPDIRFAGLSPQFGPHYAGLNFSGAF